MKLPFLPAMDHKNSLSYWNREQEIPGIDVVPYKLWKLIYVILQQIVLMKIPLRAGKDYIFILPDSLSKIKC